MFKCGWILTMKDSGDTNVRSIYKYTFTLFLIFYHVAISIGSVPCSKVDSCSCKFPSGDKVDLSPLDSKSPTEPTFEDVPPDSGNDVYSWNPCTSFTEGKCENVAVCDIRADDTGASYFNIGTQDTGDFSYDSDGDLQITYAYTDQGVQRNSYIKLACEEGQTGLFTAIGESPLGSGKYYFQLKSQTACYPPQSTGSGGKLSVGSVVTIAILGIFVIYLIGGIVFQSAIRKSKGVERLPNHAFWVEMPSLIKDGVLFIVRRGKSSERQKLLK